MKILVISGGSGNDALIKGLKKLYPKSDVTVLVNAYDNGKSTGVCRRVTDTLGVSDIRKNHSRMYKATAENPNALYLEFYEGRFNLTPGNETIEVCSKLQSWGLDDLIPYAVAFFNRPEAQGQEFNDFSISNIIYSAMYAEHGYEYTNAFFTSMLDLPDFVILNSFDNVYIQAITESGDIIDDEGKIVEWANPDDKICGIRYANQPEVPSLCDRAVRETLDADLIVISTGTYWASIYPTLEYGGFFNVINKSSARKIWAINNEEDKDAYGVTNLEMMEHFSKLGLSLDDFTILLNADARESLRIPCDNSVTVSMENNNGKHNGDQYARAILKVYYNILSNDEYDLFAFDFDDTLWARDADNDLDALRYSRENMLLLNKLKNATIISGNAYSRIRRKLATIYGSTLSGFDVDTWADCNAIRFRGNKLVGYIPELMLQSSHEDFCKYMEAEYGILPVPNNPEYVSCLKIKPLSKLDKKLVSNYLNDYLFSKFGMDGCYAVPTGRSTVDIMSTRNNKAAVLYALGIDPQRVLYVGDEVDSGNDADIARICKHSIHIENIFETNTLLKLLTE